MAHFLPFLLSFVLCSMMHDPGLLVKLSQSREERVGGSHPKKKKNKKAKDGSR
jgi:hypothetical protein